MIEAQWDVGHTVTLAGLPACVSVVVFGVNALLVRPAGGCLAEIGVGDRRRDLVTSNYRTPLRVACP